jgi:hypothetical protein
MSKRKQHSSFTWRCAVCRAAGHVSFPTAFDAQPDALIAHAHRDCSGQPVLLSGSDWAAAVVADWPDVALNGNGIIGGVERDT